MILWTYEIEWKILFKTTKSWDVLLYNIESEEHNNISLVFTPIYKYRFYSVHKTFQHLNEFMVWL